MHPGLRIGQLGQETNLLGHLRSDATAWTLLMPTDVVGSRP